MLSRLFSLICLVAMATGCVSENTLKKEIGASEERMKKDRTKELVAFAGTLLPEIEGKVKAGTLAAFAESGLPNKDYFVQFEGRLKEHLRLDGEKTRDALGTMSSGVLSTQNDILAKIEKHRDQLKDIHDSVNNRGGGSPGSVASSGNLDMETLPNGEVKITYKGSSSLGDAERLIAEQRRRRARDAEKQQAVQREQQAVQREKALIEALRGSHNSAAVLDRRMTGVEQRVAQMEKEFPSHMADLEVDLRSLNGQVEEQKTMFAQRIKELADKFGAQVHYGAPSERVGPVYDLNGTWKVCPDSRRRCINAWRCG